MCLLLIRTIEAIALLGVLIEHAHLPQLTAADNAEYVLIYMYGND